MVFWLLLAGPRESSQVEHLRSVVDDNGSHLGRKSVPELSSPSGSCPPPRVRTHWQVPVFLAELVVEGYREGIDEVRRLLGQETRGRHRDWAEFGLGLSDP